MLPQVTEDLLDRGDKTLKLHVTQIYGFILLYVFTNILSLLPARRS